MVPPTGSQSDVFRRNNRDGSIKCGRRGHTFETITGTAGITLGLSPLSYVRVLFATLPLLRVDIVGKKYAENDWKRASSFQKITRNTIRQTIPLGLRPDGAIQ